ncbi:MAG TPA: transposase [Actinophytocola sp.]|nr:transposase [Actinophytocola sp.]
MSLHAGYAAAVRAALPDALIAVDHFHLIMLANKAVTAVRQRVTRARSTRRGRIELPAPRTVALHPAHPPIVSEELDGARLRSESQYG